MAVDQARHMNMNINFFREILPPHHNNNMSNNMNNNINLVNNNEFHSNNLVNLPATTMNNNEAFQPLYNLNNDVIFQQLPVKGVLPPAVKDDSGITFNNNSSLIVQQPSRKRPREQIPCVAPQLLTMNHLPATCTVPNATTPSRSTGSINLVNKEVSSFGFLGDDLSLQVMQQQLELDRLISNHMEKVRAEIEERKKHQMRKIMAMVEEALVRRLRDKDEELMKVGKINWALEEKVKSLCLENQIWRDLAQTNEATVNALRTNLEQVVQQMKDNVERTAAADVADDAVSCCGSCGYGDVEDRDNEGNDQQWLMSNKRRAVGENNGVAGEDGKTKTSEWIYRGKSGGNDHNNRNIVSGRMCRKCGVGESTVLLLPCRHLCLCTTCGPAVNTCPICDVVKTASVHVNLS